MHRVTEGLTGHNVTFDYFVTSHELGQLLRRKITMVSFKVQKNKPELPPVLIALKRKEAFSSKFAFTSNTTLASYIPKVNKHMVLLSTLLRADDISLWRQDVSHHLGLQPEQRRCGQPGQGDWNIELQEDCPFSTSHLL